MATFKLNVTVSFTQSNLWILGAFDYAMLRVLGSQALCTAGLEGNHLPDSGHYYGRSLDFSSKHLKSDEDKEKVISLAKDWLVKNAKGVYYVELENKGTDNEHFHCQRNHYSF